MLYKEVVVEKGNPGTSGFSLDLNGMSVPNISSEVPVRLNFDMMLPPIGKALIFKKDGVIMANIEITAKIPRDVKMWPAVCVSFEREDMKVKRKLVTKSTITGIALCSQPNSDETIEPIIIA